MDLISYSMDKKILNYHKKLLDIEKKYLTYFEPKIDLDKYKKVKKKIRDYKLITILLYSNPEFYLELKEIELDFTRDSNELSCLEIIWLNQHYEFIEEIKSTQDEIIQLIKFAKKYQLISFIQYKYVKKILPKINTIFEYDKSMEHLYLPTENLIFYLTIEEIELFYDILDIVIAKIDNIGSKSNSHSNSHSHSHSHYSNYSNLINLAKISSDYQYINLIKKIKSKLDKNIISKNQEINI